MSIRKGFLISLASSNVSMLISFIASIFLARLLTPHEIGIFSVAYVFAGLLRTIREMGLGSYIVQEEELTEVRFRTAFGISIVIAVLTGGLLALLANSAGTFYRESGVTEALYVIAASFLLVPFGATTLSFLRRELRFMDIAVIETVAAVVQNLSAVIMAWAGLGFMSLAWSSLLGILASVLMVLFFRPPSIPWLPSLREWRRVLRFSSFVSGSSLISYINNSASDLVLGRMLSLSSVALFNRAASLSEMVGPVIMKALMTVSLPYFSEQNRAGESVLPGFLKASSLICLISIPVYLVMAVLAEPLVSILYGSQWLASIPVLKWLCLAAILRAPMSLSNQVLTALGDVRQLFVLDIKALVVKLVLVIGGAFYGLEVVAMAYCLATAITSVMRFLALRQSAGMTWRQFFSLHVESAGVALLSLAGPIVMVWWGGDPYLTLPIAGALATVGWISGILLTSNSLNGELRSMIAKFASRWRG